MSDANDLAGKHALVTGGGTGIGFGIACELLRQGCVVTIVGHIQEQIDAARKRISEELPRAELRVALGDVTVEEDMRAAVAAAADADGRLDIAVANAGSGAPGPILLLNKSDWEYCNALNITGTALTIKHAAHAMKSGGGSIVTISSAAARQVEKWMAPYSATKAAVEMLTRSAAVELAPFGIRVNCISPGLILTEGTRNLPEELLQECREDTLLSDLGQPIEIARGVVYLSGASGRWVTGSVLDIGGGMHVDAGEDFQGVARARYGAEFDAALGPESE